MKLLTLIGAGMLLALTGCANGTPDCASSEVEAFFQEDVVNPAFDKITASAEEWAERTKDDQYNGPVNQANLVRIKDRGPHIRSGLQLKDTHATEYDKDLDIYLCEGTAVVENGTPTPASIDIEYKVYSVEGGDNEFEVEFDDVFDALVVRALKN